MTDLIINVFDEGIEGWNIGIGLYRSLSIPLMLTIVLKWI
jgi:hypothetical protein